MADVDFDQKGQYEQIKPWVLENERLHAVYDCKGAGTGFVGITNKRIIFYDKAFMRKGKAARQAWSTSIASGMRLLCPARYFRRRGAVANLDLAPGAGARRLATCAVGAQSA